MNTLESRVIGGVRIIVGGWGGGGGGVDRVEKIV